MSYPPGTWAGDPNAPWNEPEGEECPECGGEGQIDHPEGCFKCENCGGTGYIDPPTPQEIAETKAEIDADRRLSE